MKINKKNAFKLWEKHYGDMMQDMGGGMAMDMESGEMHIVDNNSSFGSTFDNED